MTIAMFAGVGASQDDGTALPITRGRDKASATAPIAPTRHPINNHIFHRLGHRAGPAASPKNCIAAHFTFRDRLRNSR